jgi:ApbE superfamily uncharacterized protein (UPF0280 family)
MGNNNTMKSSKKGLFKESFSIKETKCTIISDKKIGIDIAKGSIIKNRNELEDYCKENPLFVSSLKPIGVTNAPVVVDLMAKSTLKANVGPMAAVAGVLADLAVLDMKSKNCEVAVVENGGEISANSNQPIDVGLTAGDIGLSNRFGFRLTDFPIGIATSSGRFSHAFSFGDAEAVTVFSKTAGLADAAATAVCNVVKGNKYNDAIKIGIEKSKSIQDVLGVLIIYNDLVGTAGIIPKIIKINPEN